MHNLHPGLILIAAGLIMLLLPNRKLRGWAGLAGAAFALFAMVNLQKDAGLIWQFTPSISFELLAVDRLSWFFGLIFCVIAVIAGIYSLNTGEKGEKCASLVYAGSSLCVVFAGDWISLICFWELMAVSSWYLVWAGGTHKAKRASYRYLVMHFFGGNMLLAGVVALCTSGITEVGLLTGQGSAAWWLILIGVSVNGAVPPLHTWVADAYPESTPSGTVYMGSYTTKVAIYALIRMFAGTQELVWVGAVMAVFAACMALLENDLRRLLSYHIVSQLGMMVAALGTGLPAGIDGAAIHAAYNILYKGVLLMGAGAIITATGRRKITELGGLYKKMPLTAVCFFIASLSIAGVPFLSGFASKALIMESLHDYLIPYWLVMLAGVGTWLSITLKINYFVFIKEPEEDFACGKVPASMQTAMVIGAVLCIVTGVIPKVFYAMLPNATMAHPFVLHHILEYLGLFVGATVPFAMLLERMAPHDLQTLDFDWFYRRPLPKLLMMLSQLVYRIFARFEKTYESFTALCAHFAKHPASMFSRIHEMAETPDEEKDDVLFEGEMPVGAFMQTFIAFCVIAFLIVLVME
ncbi:MAG: proton-conducting transporter membrane subunit [Emergencia sp.]